MTTSGDAAEQVVRLSLEGVEVAAKITGTAAKEVAALLFAALKNKSKNKIKGKQRLTSMLKSGKELTIFSVKNQDMARFVTDAKRYGVVYCVLRSAKDNPQGVCEIMVRAEDAAKINRIVENIKIATVDAEAIRENVEKKAPDSTEQAAPEKEHPAKNADDRLLDEMLDKPKQKPEAAPVNPTAARTDKSPPSAPILKPKSKSVEGTVKENRPSVREELRQIRRQQQETAAKAPAERSEPKKNNRQKTTEHRQPPRRKRVKKVKER